MNQNKINKLIRTNSATALDIINRESLIKIAPDDDLKIIKNEIKRLMDSIYTYDNNIKKGAHCAGI